MLFLLVIRRLLSSTSTKQHKTTREYTPMRLTLLYRSKTKRRVYNINVTKLVSVSVLLLSVLLISSRDSQLPGEQVALIALSQNSLQKQQLELEKIRVNTEMQLQHMLSKLKQLQSRVKQVEALGQSMAVITGAKKQNVDFVAAESDISEQNLLVQIEAALADVQHKQDQLEVLESVVNGHHIQQQVKLAGSPLAKGWLSSRYGMRKDPFNGRPKFHKGIDFAGKEGGAVVATGAGIVTWSGKRSGYGYLVEIDHGKGLVTRYGHNKSVLVKVGEVVTRGQHIALVGNTGRSTGAHVHYEVLKNGRHFDPLPYVYRKR